MLAVPYDDPEQARAALRRFLQEQGGKIDQALVAQRGR
jgi:hypothetical protein